jgi:hypothetical protein
MNQLFDDNISLNNNIALNNNISLDNNISLLFNDNSLAISSLKVILELLSWNSRYKTCFMSVVRTVRSKIQFENAVEIIRRGRENGNVSK